MVGNVFRSRHFCYLVHASFLLGLLLGPEDGCCTLLRNVWWHHIPEDKDSITANLRPSDPTHCSVLCLPLHVQWKLVTGNQFCSKMAHWPREQSVTQRQVSQMYVFTSLWWPVSVVSARSSQFHTLNLSTLCPAKWRSSVEAFVHERRCNVVLAAHQWYSGDTEGDAAYKLCIVGTSSATNRV
jgi:hypothetical protein